MTAPEQIMAEDLAVFYSFDESYTILSPPSNGVLVVAHDSDNVPMTVAVIDDLPKKIPVVKWGVMDTGQHRDDMVWFVENEALADAFVEKNSSWKKVRRLIIDTGWTDV